MGASSESKPATRKPVSAPAGAETDKTEEEKRRAELTAKADAAGAQIAALNKEEEECSGKLRDVMKALTWFTTGDSTSITNKGIVAMQERLKELQAETKKIKAELKPLIEALPEFQGLSLASKDGYAKLAELREKRMALTKEKDSAVATLWQMNRREQLDRENAEKNRAAAESGAGQSITNRTESR
ncbi:MAG: hypothetical protein QME60_01460 [Verrucomicrobiota bacterium]|nr:hypothetical protein [Verrucomicrobiota bacterium]